MTVLLGVLQPLEQTGSHTRCVVPASCLVVLIDFDEVGISHRQAVLAVRCAAHSTAQYNTTEQHRVAQMQSSRASHVQRV